MKFFPVEHLTYRTKLSPQEAIEKVKESIESKKLFRWNRYGKNKNQKPYEGEVIENTFTITRIISYRNSFIPIIKGNIESDYRGTKIIVKMRLHIIVMIFIFFWCGMISIGALAYTSDFMSTGDFQPYTLLPFGMILLAYGLALGGFKYESKKSKKFHSQKIKNP